MEKRQRAKILDYAAGFFLIVWMIMVFYRWTQGENYFFWLGAVSFILFLLLFWEYGRSVKSSFTKPSAQTEITAEERLEFEAKRQEKKIKIKAFRELIHKLAKSKNIQIEFRHPAGTGHADYPEQWRIEKPIPLSPDELYELTFFKEFVNLGILPNRDGVIYAHRFYFEDADRIEYSV